MIQLKTQDRNSTDSAKTVHSVGKALAQLKLEGIMCLKPLERAIDETSNELSNMPLINTQLVDKKKPSSADTANDIHGGKANTPCDLEIKHLNGTENPKEQQHIKASSVPVKTKDNDPEHNQTQKNQIALSSLDEYLDRLKVTEGVHGIRLLYKAEEKQLLFRLMTECGMTLTYATKAMSIPYDIARKWVRKHKYIEIGPDRGGYDEIITDNKRNIAFTDEHIKFVKKLFQDEPSISFKDAKDLLMKKYPEIVCSDWTMRMFFKNQCEVLLSTSQKRTLYRKGSRGPKEVRKWLDQFDDFETDFKTKCVFIGEAFMYIKTDSKKRIKRWFWIAICPEKVLHLEEIEMVVDGNESYVADPDYFTRCTKKTIQALSDTNRFEPSYFVIPFRLYKGEEVMSMISEAGYKPIRLPEYYPDISPIESMWKRIKRIFPIVSDQSFDPLHKEVIRRVNHNYEYLYNFRSLECLCTIQNCLSDASLSDLDKTNTDCIAKGMTKKIDDSMEKKQNQDSKNSQHAKIDFVLEGKKNCESKESSTQNSRIELRLEQSTYFITRRKRIAFTDEHIKFVKKLFQDQPSISFKDAKDLLMKKYPEIVCSDWTMRMFFKNQCEVLLSTSQKRTLYRKGSRGPKEVRKWLDQFDDFETDFKTKCVFIGEAFMYIKTDSKKRIKRWFWIAICPEKVLHLEEIEMVVDGNESYVADPDYFTRCTKKTIQALSDTNGFEPSYFVIPFRLCKGEEVMSMISEAGYKPIRLPEYYPDISPIESMWKHIKRIFLIVSDQSFDPLHKEVIRRVNHNYKYIYNFPSLECLCIIQNCLSDASLSDLDKTNTDCIAKGMTKKIDDSMEKKQNQDSKNSQHAKIDFVLEGKKNCESKESSTQNSRIELRLEQSTYFIKRCKRMAFTDEHIKFVKKLFQDEPSISFKDAKGLLMKNYPEIVCSDNTIRMFFKNQCGVLLSTSQKRTLYRKGSRGPKEVRKWLDQFDDFKTDFKTKCVFIGEAFMYTNTNTKERIKRWFWIAICPEKVLHLEEIEMVVDGNESYVADPDYFTRCTKKTIQALSDTNGFEPSYFVIPFRLYKGDEAMFMISEAGYKPIRLPEYYPDISPVENMWKHIKRIFLIVSDQSFDPLYKEVIRRVNHNYEYIYNFPSLECLCIIQNCLSDASLSDLDKTNTDCIAKGMTKKIDDSMEKKQNQDSKNSQHAKIDFVLEGKKNCESKESSTQNSRIELRLEKGTYFIKRCRRIAFTDEHIKFVKKLFQDEPSISFKDAKDLLMKKYPEIVCSDWTVRMFFKNQCEVLLSTSQKRTLYRKGSRGPKELRKWLDQFDDFKTDFKTKCVFIGEAFMYIKTDAKKRIKKWFWIAICPEKVLHLEEIEMVMDGNESYVADPDYFIRCTKKTIQALSDTNGFEPSYFVIPFRLCKGEEVMSMISKAGYKPIRLPEYYRDISLSEQFWRVVKSRALERTNRSSNDIQKELPIVIDCNYYYMLSASYKKTLDVIRNFLSNETLLQMAM